MTTADQQPITENNAHARLKGAAPSGVPWKLILLAAATVALAVLFWDAAANLWLRWGKQQELSHSYFIPLISAWLVWTNRETVKKSVGAPSWWGAALIGLAMALLVLGKLTSIYLFQHLAMVVSVAGLVALFGGVSLLRSVAAPVAFLLFAVPPPYWVITVLSWKFQQISSVLGVAMIELMGIPVYLSGNIIDLGDYQLQVAEACSGLRYLFPFLSLGVIAAYMYRGPFWHKAVIVAATFPITILMNSFRIAVTGALVQAYGVEHAEGALHFFEGWVVFLLCLAALFGVVAILTRLTKPKQNPLDALTTPDLHASTPSRGAKTAPALIAATLAIFVAGAGLVRVATVDSLIIPDREVFAGVPYEFADWQYTIRPMDPGVAEVLGADDTIVADFIAPDETPYNLYMAYLDAQRDGRSWHSPRQCIPGGGWKITAHTVVKTKTADGKPFAYNRMIIENGSNRQLVYYWYDQRGRKVANEFVMKFWLIYDAVMRKRSDGAMVRLITPIRVGTPAGEADDNLRAMATRVNAFLPAYVPK